VSPKKSVRSELNIVKVEPTRKLVTNIRGKETAKKPYLSSDIVCLTNICFVMCNDSKDDMVEDKN
jgi:hypothetical protein